MGDRIVFGMRQNKTINGRYKAELIHRQSWKNREAVDMATLRWVHLVQP